MIRRVAPQPDVDWMVSPSWNGRRLSSPAARQGRALAPGLDGRLPFQHLHANDRDSWRSRCPQYFPLALKHGICRKSNPRNCQCSGPRQPWQEMISDRMMAGALSRSFVLLVNSAERSQPACRNINALGRSSPSQYDLAGELTSASRQS